MNTYDAAVVFYVTIYCQQLITSQYDRKLRRKKSLAIIVMICFLLFIHYTTQYS